VILVKVHTEKLAASEGRKLWSELRGVMVHGMNGPGGFTATAREALRDGDKIVSGHLRQATKGAVEATPNRILGIVETSNYGLCVEDGTKPHWPPFLAILKWVAARGIGREFGEARIKNGVLGRAKQTSHWKAALNMGYDHARSLVDAHPDGVRTYRGEARIKNGVLGRASSMTVSAKLKAARLRLTLGPEEGKFAMVSRRFMGTAMNSSERAQRGVAFLIQRKISRVGTRAYPFIEPAIAEMWPKLLVNVGKVLAGKEWR